MKRAACPSQKTRPTAWSCSDFRRPAGWKLTEDPWVLSLFCAAFTRPAADSTTWRTHPCPQLRLNRQGLREDWSGKNYADDGVPPGSWLDHRPDGKFVYELTEPSVRFLSYVDGFTSQRFSLKSSRLATLLSRVETPAYENPIWRPTHASPS